MLLPGTGVPPCINSPRSVHDSWVLRRSINFLALTFMVFGTLSTVSTSSPCMTLPTVSVGGGGDRRVSNNRGSTKAIFRACSIYASTCLSKGRITEPANGASKADRKPPVCSCRMCLLLAMGNRLLTNSRSSFLYFFNRLLCVGVNGTFPFKML